MLIEGLAWHYKDYSTSKEYSQLEDTARLVLIWIQYLFILIFWLLIINATTYIFRQQKKGIFRQKNPTPPWEWRKKKRTKNEKTSNENKNSKSKKDESESSSGCILT